MSLQGRVRRRPLQEKAIILRESFDISLYAAISDVNQEVVSDFSNGQKCWQTLSSHLFVNVRHLLPLLMAIIILHEHRARTNHVVLKRATTRLHV